MTSAAVVLAAVCASASCPSSGSQDSAAPPSAPAHAPQGGPPGGLAEDAGTGVTAYGTRVSAFRKWGLRVPTRKPPAPPAVKPELPPPLSPPPVPEYPDLTPDLTPDLAPVLGPSLAPVISSVPTDDRVVFLTIDDGSEQDPEFVELLRDLNVPVSTFLTHEEVGDGYGYFRELQRLGNGMNNHAVHHVNLSALPYAAQREEICGQQQNLEREFGVRPRLFRPPYGRYDADTLRAAASCGVEAVVMWRLEAWADHIDWQAADRTFRPGDIILTHFRGPAEWGGTMNDMTRRVLRTAAEQGFAVARLEDYL